MLFAVALFAQGTVIEVQGVAEYPREIDRYQADITISPLNYYSYDQRDKPSLDELTSQFFRQMEENGFDRDRFKPAERPKYYAAAQEDDAVVYQFETTSTAEIEQLIAVKRLNGIYVSGGQTYYKPLADPTKVIMAALQDAKKSAETVAKAMGKTIGDVVSVADQSRLYTGQVETFYDGEKTGKYYVLVKFATE